LLKTLGPNQPNLSHIYHIYIRGKKKKSNILEHYYDPKGKEKSIKLINNFCFQILLLKNYYNPSWQNLLGLGKTNFEIMTHSLSEGVLLWGLSFEPSNLLWPIFATKNKNKNL
jgi:hypothetical protein